VKNILIQQLGTLETLSSLRVPPSVSKVAGWNQCLMLRLRPPRFGRQQSLPVVAAAAGSWRIRLDSWPPLGGSRIVRAGSSCSCFAPLCALKSSRFVHHFASSWQRQTTKSCQPLRPKPVGASPRDNNGASGRRPKSLPPALAKIMNHLLQLAARLVIFLRLWGPTRASWLRGGRRCDILRYVK